MLALDNICAAHLSLLVVFRRISTATEREDILFESSRPCWLCANKGGKLFQLSLLACR